MDASQEMSRWRDTIADLNKKHGTAEGRVERLKRRKSPLTLAACTGDEKARAKLGALNGQLLAERQGLEDLEEAVAQAEAELAKAQEVLAIEKEAECLRVLARLATERIKAAKVVDQQCQVLAKALGAYYGLGDQLYRHVGSRDVKFGAKIRSRGRADAALATHLAAVTGCVSRNPSDPRDGHLLEVMEEDQLASLLINVEKAHEIAGMNPPGEPTGEPTGESESRAA